MNGKILQKCIDKLKTKKDDADIQYVLGMLEALAEMLPEDKKVCPTPRDPLAPGTATPPSTIKKTPEMDDAAMIEAKAIEDLKKIDKGSIQTEN